MEAQPQLTRRVHQRLEDAGPPCRKDVVMIGRERAAAEEQTGHRGPRGHAHDVGVDAHPHRVKRLQPLEERAVGNVGARRPLVHVVVGVDEPGHGDAVRLVYDLVSIGSRS